MDHTHESRIVEMEEMKINSEIGYKRNRVMNGHSPHKMLEMIQQEMLGKLANKDSQEKNSDSNLKEEETILSHHKLTEVKK
jgi:hypothetical protein